MAGKPPEGFYRVRGHLRRKPGPSRKRMSGWTIAAIVAGSWLWGQFIGFGEATENPAPAPKPSMSASVER
ncbi:hypothetical protein ACIQ7Q_24575 [Streptomyces sp. NPDC096176]|uniref:hypothetical protein n=1 Tax=Streptomyces sp. NPDC096176 TaxID=3366079 RepID=UPI00380EB09C